MVEKKKLEFEDLPANHGFVKGLCGAARDWENYRGEKQLTVHGIKEYKGKRFYAIQVFYEDDTNTLKPGKCSPTVPLDEMAAMIPTWIDIQKHLAKKGYDDGKTEKKQKGAVPNKKTGGTDGTQGEAGAKK